MLLKAVHENTRQDFDILLLCVYFSVQAQDDARENSIPYSGNHTESRQALYVCMHRKQHASTELSSLSHLFVIK